MSYGTVWDAARSIGAGGAINVDYVDGQINIHGQLVGGDQARPVGPIDQLLEFVKLNPLLCVGGAVGLFLVLRK